MLRLICVAGLFGLVQCGKDETVAGYGGAERVWELTEIDGLPFAQLATLSFPEPGKITGKAPCNTFQGKMEAPYPWFETGPLAITRRSCPELDAENRFLTALGDMSQSEVSGNTMILSNANGHEMVFRSTE